MVEKPEEMRYNLLYDYSLLLCGNRERFSRLIMGDEYNVRLDNARYLVSFILKHILMLESREEALQYIKDNPQVCKDCKLDVLIMKNDYFKIGNVVINDYEFAFRMVYGEMTGVDDMYKYLDETTQLKDRTKDKIREILKAEP